MATTHQRDISTPSFSRTKPVLKSSQVNSNGSILPATYTEAQTIDSLETYLLANGYTQVQLNSMTKNDKVYAYRLRKGATTAP